MIIDGNKVTADENMWLVKENVWAKYIFIGINDASENWREATQAEYDEAHPSELPIDDELTAEEALGIITGGTQ